MIVAPHFELEEFLRSSSFPELAANADDVPPEALLNLSRLVWSTLVPLRKMYGRIVISSGYRLPALNAKVGGSDRSRHVTGCAADFVTKDHAPREVWQELMTTPFHAMAASWDRLAFYEGGRFHVDISGNSEGRGLLYLATDKGWVQCKNPRTDKIHDVEDQHEA